MGIQTKILQRKMTVTKDGQTIAGSVGALALGKPGDIIARAYGPVVRAAVNPQDAAFGNYVTGLGILVNSGDCDGVGLKFETVTTLKAGQVGSYLVSGACVVKQSQVAAIEAAMNVQNLEDGTPFNPDEWVKVPAWAASTAYKVGDYVTNSNKYYKCTTATTGDESFPTAKFTEQTPEVYSEYAVYAAGSLVKKSSSDADAYTNPKATMDGVVCIEVNGFAAA